MRRGVDLVAWGWPAGNVFIYRVLSREKAFVLCTYIYVVVLFTINYRLARAAWSIMITTAGRLLEWRAREVGFGVRIRWLSITQVWYQDITGHLKAQWVVVRCTWSMLATIGLYGTFWYAGVEWNADMCLEKFGSCTYIWGVCFSFLGVIVIGLIVVMHRSWKVVPLLNRIYTMTVQASHWKLDYR